MASNTSFRKIFLNNHLKLVAVLVAGFLALFYLFPEAFNSQKYVYDAAACPDSSMDCLQNHYQMLVKDYGADVAFEDVKKRYEVNSVIQSNCHPIMHVIGQEASVRYDTVSEAYLYGDNFCWSGYYHGIMEGIVSRIGKEELPAELNTICADIPGKEEYNFNYYNCVHGLGHGVMELLADEVPASLEMCGNLNGYWEQESCYGGVFMENIIANNNYGTSKYLKPEEPLYPCNIVEDAYKFQCYLGQTSYALEVNGYNFEKVFDLCATVEGYRDICNQSMGRDAANQAMHEKEATKRLCELADTNEDRINCVIGAVKEIISYYHNDSEALEYCAILPESDKEVCLSTAEAYYKLF